MSGSEICLMELQLSLKSDARMIISKSSQIPSQNFATSGDTRIGHIVRSNNLSNVKTGNTKLCFSYSVDQAERRRI